MSVWVTGYEKSENLCRGIVEPPQGITVEVPEQRKIIISGINKEMVGAFAAQVRGYREPEPYKGKGIKYVGEHVRRKAGKAVAGAGGGA